METKCIAIENGTICTSERIGKSKHCKVHHKKALQMYLEYKRLWNLANLINLKQQFDNLDEKIKFLNKSYVTLNNAYIARYQHNKQFISEEYWDDTHKYQFTFIKKKIVKTQ